MDYDKTVNLPQTDFPMRAGLPKREPEMLQAMYDKDLYHRMVGRNEGKPLFVLHEEIAREKPAPVHHGECRKISVLVLLRIALHVYFAAREHPHEVLLNQHFPAAAEQARVYVRYVLQRGQQRARAQRAFAVAIPAADDHFFPIGL